MAIKMEQLIIGTIICSLLLFTMLDLYSETAINYGVNRSQYFNETFTSLDEARALIDRENTDLAINESGIVAGISIDENAFKTEVKQGFKVVAFGFTKIPKIINQFFVDATGIIGIPPIFTTTLMIIITISLVFYLLRLFFQRA